MKNKLKNPQIYPQNDTPNIVSPHVKPPKRQEKNWRFQNI